MYSEKIRTTYGGVLYDIFEDDGTFIRSFQKMGSARKMLGKISTGTRLRGPYAKNNPE